MRLIDADELKKSYKNLNKTAIEFEIAPKGIIDLIDNAPTVEGEILTKEAYSDLCWRASKERPQGEWIYNQYDANARIGNWHCSICHNICYEMKLAHDNYNFCPKCGAEMRGKE